MLNVLHVAMPLEFLPRKEARLLSCLGVINPASAADNGAVERQDPSSLEKMIQTQN